MAEIRWYPLLRHLRAEISSHILRYRKGKLVRSGRGLSFWFYPLSTSVAEVPIDDLEVPFLFHGRSADFQDLMVQGEVTCRVVDPAELAERIDFTIDVASGEYLKQPLDRLTQLITQQAQQSAVEYLVERPLERTLAEGVDALRKRIRDGLEVSEIGIQIASVRIAAIKPTADLERALQTPTLELLQQQADEATFQRRAMAVEKERAISENELRNRIELARQEEELIAQAGQNKRKEAEDDSVARQIEDAAEAECTRLQGAAQADRIRNVEGARVEAEQQRVAAYRDLRTPVILGLAAQELATKLRKIDHLSITPELLGPLFNELLSNASARLKPEGQA